MIAAPWDSAARVLAEAETLLIHAGAGMGVDSGLPDFRGTEGFWRAYPPYARLGKNFYDLATPATFVHDPALGWGFYGHRRNLYRATQPHAGFAILRRWAERKPGGAFVLTSNVDGHFQRAGFPENRVVECHGTLEFLQCLVPCIQEIWPADDLSINLDEESIRAMEPLPHCPHCGGLARPAVLMFNDGQWVSRRTEEQQERWRQWLTLQQGKRVAILEIGAGVAVPTVRLASERLADVSLWNATLIRINPREPEVPGNHLSIPSAALAALRQLDTG